MPALFPAPALGHLAVDHVLPPEGTGLDPGSICRAVPFASLRGKIHSARRSPLLAARRQLHPPPLMPWLTAQGASVGGRNATVVASDPHGKQKGVKRNKLLIPDRRRTLSANSLQRGSNDTTPPVHETPRIHRSPSRNLTSIQIKCPPARFENTTFAPETERGRPLCAGSASPASRAGI